MNSQTRRDGAGPVTRHLRLGWLRQMDAADVRHRVAGWTDSEAAGFVAAGVVLTLRFMLATTDELTRELKGLARVVARHRAARTTADADRRRSQ